MGKSPDHMITRSPNCIVLPRLYAIIDPAQTCGRSCTEVAVALLAAGVRLIQLRDKQAPSGEMYATAQRLQDAMRKAGTTFIVNDRADIACAADADGVHLGQDDLPVEAARSLMGNHKLIGHSTHVLDQVTEADDSTADYIAFGPIFTTASKQNPDAVVGLEGLREARKATQKPLVAIGGITLENAGAVVEAGADSVAVIRDLVGVPNIAKRAEAFLRVVSGARSKLPNGGEA